VARILLLLVAIASTTVALAQPRPIYKGPGGQIEAAGIIAGTYMLTAATIEACEKHPQIRERSHKTLQAYLSRNHQVYMDVMRKLPLLANANGGSAEVARLKRELETDLDEKEARRVAVSRADTVAKCTSLFDAADKGTLDLRIYRNNEVVRILNY